MGEPDVASLVARLSLPALLAWMAYYGVEPWDLPSRFVEGFAKSRAPGTDLSPGQEEALLDRALRVAP